MPKWLRKLIGRRQSQGLSPEESKLMSIDEKRLEDLLRKLLELTSERGNWTDVREIRALAKDLLERVTLSRQKLEKSVQNWARDEVLNSLLEESRKEMIVVAEIANAVEEMSKAVKDANRKRNKELSNLEKDFLKEKFGGIFRLKKGRHQMPTDSGLELGIVRSLIKKDYLQWNKVSGASGREIEYYELTNEGVELIVDFRKAQSYIFDLLRLNWNKARSDLLKLPATVVLTIFAYEPVACLVNNIRAELF